MKKRDLLFAGLLLFSASAFAQLGPNGETEPVRYKDDARQVYFQNFDGSSDWTTIRLNPDPKRPTTLYTWEADPIDVINQVAYYKRQYSKDKDTLSTDDGNGSATIDYKKSEWKIAGYRDTVMNLYNGVMRTDAPWPEDSILNYDSHQIVSHTGESQSGTGIGGKDYGLDRYGEDGGTSYFRYNSTNGSGVGSYSNGVVPSYRRNLFVRLKPGDVEPNSSYRVTVFVKAKKQAATDPQMGVQLMRGYFHSEKDFSMAGGSTAFNNRESFTDFEDNKWAKIVLMSYYLNDSVADAYTYSNGYWWGSDWTWKTTANKADSTAATPGDTSMIFRYIQQPDKFFIRVSFRSDSTRFDVDNLSVTKSWIGGVEYYGDMIRVDFGYDTNLGKLAEAAKEQNKIAAVELPGEYFDVWALWSDDEGNSEWEYMDINSAEYQGDGYMYMWTKPYNDGTVRELTGADSILVTFRNPVDRDDLKLVYNGSRYPNSLDAEWAKTKNVFDFHNEIAALNPTITISPKTKKAVKSLKNLPPVMQREGTENGTFGLDPTTRSFTFKFSRNLAFDNAGASTKLTQVTMTKSGVTEYWDIADYGDITNGMTTVTRPAKYTEPLSGDYVLTFKQVTHLAKGATDEDFGDDASFNYHFGTFSKNPVIELKYWSDWRSEIDNYNDGDRPLPESLYAHAGSKTGEDNSFRKGENVKSGMKVGLYPIYDDSIIVAGVKVPDNCLFYLSNRVSDNTGNLYSILNMKKGSYTIEFKFGGWASTSRPMALKFYAKPEGALENGDDKGFAVLEAVADKTVLEAEKTPAVSQGSSAKTTDHWKDGIETLVYNFTVPADGDYVFEWIASGSSNYEGIVISNYWIKTAGDLSVKYVNDLNEAIAAIDAKLAAAADAKYQGAAYTALTNTKTEATGFIDALTTAGKGHAPSAYKAEIATINAAIDLLQARIDTVDLFAATVGKIVTALADETYKATGVYGALEDLLDEMNKVNVASKNNAELAVLVADAEAAIAQLGEVPFAIRNIQELDTLAVKLGSTVDQTDVIKNQLASLDNYDANLAAALKAAIALEIYKKAAAADTIVDSLDVTPFIRNYFLYVTPKIVERTDLKANSSGAKNADPNGANIQHVQHQWNSGDLNGQMPIWIMIEENDITNLYPGWTARAYAAGNCMVTPETEAAGYARLRDPQPVFDGVLAMDWNGKAEMKSTVDNLPNGMYSLGVALAKNTGSSTELKLKADGKDVAGKINGGVIAADSFLVANGNIDIDFILTSGSGWSQADNFFLTFYPAAGVDYAAAATAQQTALDELITVVDPVQVKAAKIEYFTLDGVKVVAPKAGAVSIKVSTLPNGKRIVEKVLVK